MTQQADLPGPIAAHLIGPWVSDLTCSSGRKEARPESRRTVTRQTSLAGGVDLQGIWTVGNRGQLEYARSLAMMCRISEMTGPESAAASAECGE